MLDATNEVSLVFLAHTAFGEGDDVSDSEMAFGLMINIGETTETGASGAITTNSCLSRKCEETRFCVSRGVYLIAISNCNVEELDFLI